MGEKKINRIRMLLWVLVALLAALGWSQWRESKNVLYFAYGSNTNASYFRDRLASPKFVGTATLANHQCVMHRHANLDLKEGAEVQGVLWRLSLVDLGELDRIEENYYRKEVLVMGKRSYRAETYFMKKVENEPPSRQYVEMVREGYGEHGLPWDQIVTNGA